ncbi:MAG: ATP-dependent Clp protease proteolytic subunit [Clostridiales bacterium]|nr:ATP-dependent Clp protease proteolytic subunit [Clostridiales bacterium]
MDVFIRNSRGNYSVSTKSLLLSDRVVFIEGEITHEAANEFKRTIMFLLDDSEDEPISIHINSNGGSVDAGLLIYDILKGIEETEVNIYCTGTAASMAAVILAGGQKGRRFILPHSRVMIHEPLIAGGVEGRAAAIQKTAESILETKKQLVELLAADTGKTKKEIEEAISYDNFFNAEQAVEFGLADAVVKKLV